MIYNPKKSHVKKFKIIISQHQRDRVPCFSVALSKLSHWIASPSPPTDCPARDTWKKGTGQAISPALSGSGKSERQQ